MKHPRLSVLLPCRNAALYLDECIASLGAQSFEDFELLAVDDHSTDDTLSILAAWAARDRRVQVISSESPGLVAALNSGLARVQGDYIARMDADDVALPSRFKEQLAAFDQDESLIACGTRVQYVPRPQVTDGALRYEEWLNALTDPSLLAHDMFVECPIAHPTLMIRMEAMKRMGGYCDRGWPEDYDLILRLFVCGARMTNVPEILLEWRDRPDRLSRVDARYALQAFRRCKVHYMKKWQPQLDDVVVWGAGPVGKAFAQEFASTGVTVRAFVDIDPRKIGQVIRGAPVIAPAQLHEYRDSMVVAAVSGASARGQIRAALRDAGRHELLDFVAVA